MVIATYALLFAAVLCLWAGSTESPVVRRLLWTLPLLGAVVAGLANGIVLPIALVWIGALAIATFGYATSTSRLTCAASATGVVLVSAGLMAHQLPGFNNPEIIARTRFSADAIPFRLHLNFDKTLVGLFIVGVLHPRIIRLSDGLRMLARVWPVTVAMIGLLLLLAFASGYVHFDPKLASQWWIWVAVNLGFTCVAEEALFRAFVQRELQRWWSARRGGRSWALAVAAVLFGIAHAAGGPAYVALATVAGAGYGWAYLRTGRIEASILTHFALNATHFFFFTYPAIQRTAE